MFDAIETRTFSPTSLLKLLCFQDISSGPESHPGNEVCVPDGSGFNPSIPVAPKTS